PQHTDRFLFVWLYRLSFRSQRDCNSPPRDDHPPSSRGVPVVLARAITQTDWQAENFGRAAQYHRRDEPCKSPLGCASPHDPCGPSSPPTHVLLSAIIIGERPTVTGGRDVSGPLQTLFGNAPRATSA